ncbi:MAG: ABC transporter permease [Verrucomicrobiaceae bacterium]|nr:ABC transporter permease [Verrucomicrobiaceae bacterium]
MISKSDYENIKTVFKREFFAYFNSPVAYVIVVIFLLATMSFAFFFGGFLRTNNASLTQPFFFWHPWIYVVLAPAVGMRLWSEEQRLGTLELLLTMPISPWHAIVGKYFAAALVWAIALFLTCPIVFTVFYLGNPDSGPIISGYLASYLYAIAALAVTSAVSAFTRSQVVCFIVSVAVCLMMTLIGFPPVIEAILKSLPSGMDFVVKGVAYTSFMDHFYEMTKGVIYPRDVIYFLSVVAVSLLITNEAIRAKRA